MSQFTLDDLRRILRQCAGEDDGVDLDEDISAVDFAELGYDSVSLLEVAAQIDREFGIAIPDELLADLVTPGRFVAAVNEVVTAAAVTAV